MKRFLMVAVAASMSWWVADACLANGFGDDAQWELSEDSSVCRPDQTGRICAEWRSESLNFEIICCVEPSAIGTTNLNACVEVIGGSPGFEPDRDVIE